MMMMIEGILQFRLQFGIDLDEWVFQKAKIPPATFSFLKNSEVQINFKFKEENRMISHK